MIRKIVPFVLIALILTGCSWTPKQMQQDPYEVISCGTSDDTSLFIKYSTYTGEAWILSDKWMQIPDDEKLPESKYVIKVVSMAGHRYAAIRIDTVTGRSWSAINNRWVEIKSKDQDFSGARR